jgi:hypothetical protein
MINGSAKERVNHKSRDEYKNFCRKEGPIDRFWSQEEGKFLSDIHPLFIEKLKENVNQSAISEDRKNFWKEKISKVPPAYTFKLDEMADCISLEGTEAIFSLPDIFEIFSHYSKSSQIRTSFQEGFKKLSEDQQIKLAVEIIRREYDSFLQGVSLPGLKLLQTLISANVNSKTIRLYYQKHSPVFQNDQYIEAQEYLVKELKKIQGLNSSHPFRGYLVDQKIITVQGELKKDVSLIESVQKLQKALEKLEEFAKPVGGEDLSEALSRLLFSRFLEKFNSIEDPAFLAHKTHQELKKIIESGDTDTKKLTKSKQLLEKGNMPYRVQLKELLNLSSEEKKSLEIREDNTSPPSEPKKLALAIQAEAQSEELSLYGFLAELAYLSESKESLKWLLNQVSYERYKQEVGKLPKSKDKDKLIEEQQKLDKQPLETEEKIKQVAKLLIPSKISSKKELLQILKVDPALLSKKQEIKIDPNEQKLQQFEALSFPEKVAFLQNPSEAFFIPTVLNKGSQDAISAAYEALLQAISEKDSDEWVSFFETYYSPSGMLKDFQEVNAKWEAFTRWFSQTKDIQSPFKSHLTQTGLYVSLEYFPVHNKYYGLMSRSKRFLLTLQNNSDLLEKHRKKELNSLSWDDFAKIEEFSLEIAQKHPGISLGFSEKPLDFKSLDDKSPLKRFLKETKSNEGELRLGIGAFCQVLGKEMTKMDMKPDFLKGLVRAYEEEDLEKISKLAKHLCCLKYLNALNPPNKPNWKDGRNGSLLEDKDLLNFQKNIDSLPIETRVLLDDLLEGDFFIKAFHQDMDAQIQWFSTHFGDIGIEKYQTAICKINYLSSLFLSLNFAFSLQLKHFPLSRNPLLTTLVEIAISHEDLSFLDWVLQKLKYEIYLKQIQSHGDSLDLQVFKDLPPHCKLEKAISDMKELKGESYDKCLYENFDDFLNVTDCTFYCARSREYLTSCARSSPFLKILEGKKLDFNQMTDDRLIQEIFLFSEGITQQINKMPTFNSSRAFFKSFISTDTLSNISDLDLIQVGLNAPDVGLILMLNKKKISCAVDFLMAWRDLKDVKNSVLPIEKNLSSDETLQFLEDLLQKSPPHFRALLNNAQGRVKEDFARFLKEKILYNPTLSQKDKWTNFENGYLSKNSVDDLPTYTFMKSVDMVSNEKLTGKWQEIENWLDAAKKQDGSIEVSSSLKEALRKLGIPTSQPTFLKTHINRVRDLILSIASPYLCRFLQKENRSILQTVVNALNFELLDGIISVHKDLIESRPFDAAKEYEFSRQRLADIPISNLEEKLKEFGWKNLDELSIEQNLLYFRLFIQGILQELRKKSTDASGQSEKTFKTNSEAADLYEDLILEQDLKAKEECLRQDFGLFKERDEDLSFYQRMIRFDQTVLKMAEEMASKNINFLYEVMIDEAFVRKDFRALYCLKQAIGIE